ncbi:hypothetical protein [Psychroflexus sp. MBR-150]|jgi:hypothetical protein
MNKAIYLLFTIVFLSCNNKDHDTNIKDENCNGYYAKKYSEFFNKWSMNREDKQVVDSTLYYLDKQMSCDPKNISIIQEKANFLIYNELYEKAIIEIDSVSNTDPFFKMMKGTLSLKLNKNDGEKLLREARNEFTHYIQEYNNPNDVSWKIILDNYFEGKEYALRQSAKVKKNFKEDYQKTNIQTIEQMLKEMSKKEILYHLFKIK